jgi:D-sedoheptulose 7-phosphate isomerase
MDLAAIRSTIDASSATKQRLLATSLGDIERLLRAAVDCARRGGTIFFCGNGGSSCDAARRRSRSAACA